MGGDIEDTIKQLKLRGSTVQSSANRVAASCDEHLRIQREIENNANAQLVVDEDFFSAIVSTSEQGKSLERPEQNATSAAGEKEAKGEKEEAKEPAPVKVLDGLVGKICRQVPRKHPPASFYLNRMRIK